MPEVEFVGWASPTTRGFGWHTPVGDAHPTSTAMADLMAVADANEVMPPKSTWFEPKLADGLVSHLLD